MNESVVGVSGNAIAHVSHREFEIRPLSQLVVLPGVICRIETVDGAVVEVLSLLSMPPRATTSG